MLLRRLFSFGLVVLVVCALLVMPTRVFSAGTTTITATGSGYGVGHNGLSQVYAAQSFQVSGGVLSSFSVTVGVSAGSPVGDLDWRLVADSSGPTGSVLASGQFTPSTPGGANTSNTVNVSGGVTLASSTTYWLILQPHTVQADGVRWVWQSSTSDPYASGNAAQNNAGSWTQYSGDDLDMSITTVSPTTTPVPPTNTPVPPTATLTPSSTPTFTYTPTATATGTGWLPAGYYMSQAGYACYVLNATTLASGAYRVLSGSLNGAYQVSNLGGNIEVEFGVSGYGVKVGGLNGNYDTGDDILFWHTANGSGQHSHYVRLFVMGQPDDYIAPILNWSGTEGGYSWYPTHGGVYPDLYPVTRVLFVHEVSNSLSVTEAAFRVCIDPSYHVSAPTPTPTLTFTPSMSPTPLAQPTVVFNPFATYDARPYCTFTPVVTRTATRTSYLNSTRSPSATPAGSIVPSATSPFGPTNTRVPSRTPRPVGDCAPPAAATPTRVSGAAVDVDLAGYRRNQDGSIAYTCYNLVPEVIFYIPASVFEAINTAFQQQIFAPKAVGFGWYGFQLCVRWRTFKLVLFDIDWMPLALLTINFGLVLYMLRFTRWTI